MIWGGVAVRMRGWRVRRFTLPPFMVWLQMERMGELATQVFLLPFLRLQKQQLRQQHLQHQLVLVGWSHFWPLC